MKIISSIILVCLGAVVGCRPAEPSRPDLSQLERIPVIATHSILADWVQRVGGQRVAVTTLVGVDGDVHSYEPVPQDAVALAGAAILFENGLDFEDWLDDLCESSRTRAVRVAVSREVAPRAHKCNCCPNSSEDPHVWHSVKNAIRMVEVIAAELAALDPAHGDGYRARASAYIEQLEALDAEIRRQVASLPQERRLLITSHDSFGYFASEYGFHVASLLDSFTSEAADPSAVKMVSVIRKIKDQQVSAIFSENMMSSKLTETIAREADVKIVASLYSDSLGPAESPGKDYCSMMRYNTKTIVQSLSQ